MTQKTLRELIDHTIKQIDVYRYPDTEEFSERLGPIAAALRQGSLDDTITSIGWSRSPSGSKSLGITTEYSVRGCNQYDSISIPEHIIDSPDPVHAAQVWYATQQLRKAEQNLAGAKYALDRAIESVDKLTKELDIVQNSV